MRIRFCEETAQKKELLSRLIRKPTGTYPICFPSWTFRTWLLRVRLPDQKSAVVIYCDRCKSALARRLKRRCRRRLYRGCSITVTRTNGRHARPIDGNSPNAENLCVQDATLVNVRNLRKSNLPLWRSDFRSLSIDRRVL